MKDQTKGVFRRVVGGCILGFCGGGDFSPNTKHPNLPVRFSHAQERQQLRGGCGRTAAGTGTPSHGSGAASLLADRPPEAAAPPSHLPRHRGSSPPPPRPGRSRRHPDRANARAARGPNSGSAGAMLRPNMGSSGAMLSLNSGSPGAMVRPNSGSPGAMVRLN